MLARRAREKIFHILPILLLTPSSRFWWDFLERIGGFYEFSAKLVVFFGEVARRRICCTAGESWQTHTPARGRAGSRPYIGKVVQMICDYFLCGLKMDCGG